MSWGGLLEGVRDFDLTLLSSDQGEPPEKQTDPGLKAKCKSI